MRMGERQRHADQREKGAGDDMRQRPRRRRERRRRRDQAEMGEVPDQMVDDHAGQRAAARSIDRGDARGFRRLARQLLVPHCPPPNQSAAFIPVAENPNRRHGRACPCHPRCGAASNPQEKVEIAWPAVLESRAVERVRWPLKARAMTCSHFPLDGPAGAWTARGARPAPARQGAPSTSWQPLLSELLPPSMVFDRRRLRPHRASREARLCTGSARALDSRKTSQGHAAMRSTAWRGAERAGAEKVRGADRGWGNAAIHRNAAGLQPGAQRGVNRGNSSFPRPGSTTGGH